MGFAVTSPARSFVSVVTLLPGGSPWNTADHSEDQGLGDPRLGWASPARFVEMLPGLPPPLLNQNVRFPKMPR